MFTLQRKLIFLNKEILSERWGKKEQGRKFFAHAELKGIQLCLQTVVLKVREGDVRAVIRTTQSSKSSFLLYLRQDTVQRLYTRSNFPTINRTGQWFFVGLTEVFMASLPSTVHYCIFSKICAHYI